MLLFGSLPPAPPVRALLTGGDLRLLSAEGDVVRRVRTDARELRWSPDGSTLLLRDAKGRLFRLEVAGRGGPARIAEGVATFAWTPENRVLVGLTGRGVLGLGADGREIALSLPRAESPAIAPDGARLAYTVPSDGLWSAARDGSNPRRLAASRDAHAPSWSYDARLIAWTDAGRLRLIRREGGSARGDACDLGPVEDPRAFWSPGSADLLARRAGEWQVWSARTGAWSRLDARGAEPPVWAGPRSLLSADDGRLLALLPGDPAHEIDTRRTKVVAVAVAPTTFRGEAFADPFARAPKPRRGETAWRGRLTAFDAKTGHADLAVAGEVSPAGTVLVLGQSQARSATTKDRALMKRLALPADAELQVIVRAGKIVGVDVPPLLAPPEAPKIPPKTPPTVPPVTTPPPTTPATGGTSPVEPPPVGAPRVDFSGRALRPLRAVEPDGITREVVVVPLVYPMPGPRKFTDTFLDARDGGKRRHHGNDLMAPKMTPLLAVFDGVVAFRRNTAPGASNSLTLTSDDGWTASYLHVNNDTPGTDDGLGSARYAFPADLRPGDRVRAGEVVAWCGDSGNAEDAGSHLHFELYDRDGEAIIDPFASLTAARHLDAPLYADADPSLVARKGEVRWEGVVVGVQTEKRAITVELTATGEAGGPVRRNLTPRLVYLEIPADLALEARSEAKTPFAFETVRPGQRLGAVGVIDGAKMRVRRATIEPLPLPSGPGSPAVGKSRR